MSHLLHTLCGNIKWMVESEYNPDIKRTWVPNRQWLFHVSQD